MRDSHVSKSAFLETRPTSSRPMRMPLSMNPIPPPSDKRPGKVRALVQNDVPSQDGAIELGATGSCATRLAIAGARPADPRL